MDAVREALAAVALRLNPDAPFDLAGVDVPSGVRHTPLSREEIMVGARQRAEVLLRIAREEDKPWKYFVGLEGGIDIVHERGTRWVFLENWAYVTDGTGRESFGQSGAVLLPEPLVKSVVGEGIELSEAIDAFAGGQRHSRCAGRVGRIDRQSHHAAGLLPNRGHQRFRSVLERHGPPEPAASRPSLRAVSSVLRAVPYLHSPSRVLRYSGDPYSRARENAVE